MIMLFNGKKKTKQKKTQNTILIRACLAVWLRVLFK
jgi:hypothetical protein